MAKRGAIVPGGVVLVGLHHRAAPTRRIDFFYLLSFCPSMPKAATKPDKNAAPEALPASYEAAQIELEQLIGQLESGQLPLEQLLGGYQRGAQLLQFCRDKLDAVEQQIKVLDQGVLKPWAQE